MPPGRTWLWFLGILLANYLLMRFFVPSPDAPVTVPYTLFAKRSGRATSRRSTARGDHHGPLQGAGHLPAGGRKVRHPTASQKRQVKKCGAYWRRVPNSERGRCGSPRRTQSGQ